MLQTLLSLSLIVGLIFGASAPASAENLKQIAGGNNQFALDLYNNMKSKEGNIFFSPYSISLAMAMTYGGARGETAEQMADVMHFDTDQDKFHRQFNKLMNFTEKAAGENNNRLEIANRLWGSLTEKFKESYLELTQKYYDAKLETVDFSQTEKTRKEINNWVAKQTEDKIKELLKPRDIDASTSMVLTNAIYFLGIWQTQFDPKLTKKMPFETPDGEIEVEMMHNKKVECIYGETENLQLLGIPYEGFKTAMFIALPRKGIGLKTIEENLSCEAYKQWFKTTNRDKVSLFMPKFKLSYSAQLQENLQQMGMSLPFSSSADFTEMSPGRGLYISKVIHQAFVDVNEKGTEAAAATAVTMARGMAPKVTTVRIDRPFLFFIVDMDTQNILFMGRMENPDK